MTTNRGAESSFRKRTLYPVELWGPCVFNFSSAIKRQLHFMPAFPLVSQYLWGKRGGRLHFTEVSTIKVLQSHLTAILPHVQFLIINDIIRTLIDTRRPGVFARLGGT